MASSITFSINIAGTPASLTRNLSDADALRLVAALKLYYPQNVDGAGNPIAWTNAAVLAKYANGIMAGLQGLVQQVEQQTAAATAQAAVAPVSLS